MAIDIKEPTVRAPWPPLAEKDLLYRYPKPYPVGGAAGESFGTIAKKHKLGGMDLIYYNFQTKNPAEINWYLLNYVGCPAPKPHQQYIEFFGASHDAIKHSGEIFIPMHGEPVANALNRFGERIVSNYNNTSKKEPGGLCYETCYARVKDAGDGVGVSVPDWSNGSTFSIIWGTLVAQRGWRDVPDEYKGLGAAGAMVYAGVGTLVDTVGVWRGDLEPGAVIQVWDSEAEYENAKKGNSAYGHSFIFLNYVYTGSAITGMAIADQGYQNGEPLTRKDWGVWFGANLFKQPGRDPNWTRYGPNP
jgi:hypothetical protein